MAWRIGAVALAAALVGAGGGRAADEPVRIGVLNDQSSAYSVDGGTEVVEAVRLAVEDAGPVLGHPVEVLSADHQNKADLAASLARQWYADGVDVVLDVPNSAAAFAVQALANEKKKLALFVGALSSDLTGSRCSPYTAQWAMDTWTASKVVGSAILKEGKTNWFFVGADYTFGRSLVKETSDVVEAGGGKVLGAVYAPLGSSDFSSFLLQAQSSRAQVVGLANAVNDTMNALKQGVEFGLTRSGQSFAAYVIFLSNIKTLTLEQAQGLLVPNPFYWNMNEATRAFSERFAKRVGHPPDWSQALTYSAALHYLKAVKAAGSKGPEAVMAKMREMPVNDPMTVNGVLRPDGRLARDMYLLRVKTPASAKGPWDLYEVAQTIPAAQATRPIGEGGCKLPAGG